MEALTQDQRVTVLTAAKAYRYGRVPVMTGWTKDMKKAFCLATQASSLVISPDHSQKRAKGGPAAIS